MRSTNIEWKRSWAHVAWKKRDLYFTTRKNIKSHTSTWSNSGWRSKSWNKSSNTTKNWHQHWDRFAQPEAACNLLSVTLFMLQGPASNMRCCFVERRITEIPCCRKYFTATSIPRTWTRGKQLCQTHDPTWSKERKQSHFEFAAEWIWILTLGCLVI